jgi:hypothetical protein
LLHGIISDIGGILSWIKREPKRESLLKIIKAMETKIEVQRDSLSEKDFKKLSDIQQPADDMDTNQEERNIFQNMGCCFEGFCKQKYIFVSCVNFSYIEQVRTWKRQKCCEPLILDHLRVLQARYTKLIF